MRSHCHGIQKADNTVSSSAKLLLNTTELRSCNRKNILYADYFFLLYEAKISAGRLNIKKYHRKPGSEQRRSALRVLCTYRTASEVAMQVIPACYLLTCLLAIECKEVFRQKSAGQLSIKKTKKIKQKTFEA